MKSDTEYNTYCPFDADEHKKKYVNYLEVLISKDGVAMYAVLSHQEKAIKLACDELHVSRDELSAICPREYYFDFLRWLLMVSGAAAVWNETCLMLEPTRKQVAALKMLKLKGLYRGMIPMIAKTRKR